MDKTAELIINNYLQISELKDILNDNDLPSSGVKLDLLLRLYENIELDVDGILQYLSKDKLKKICSDLNLPVSGAKDSLIESILSLLKEEPNSIIELFEEQEEIIDYNYIFDRYFTVEDVKNIARDCGLHITGNKTDIMERILKLANPTYQDILKYLNKDQLKILAGELDIERTGLRYTIEDFIREIAKKIKYNLRKIKLKEENNKKELEVEEEGYDDENEDEEIVLPVKNKQEKVSLFKEQDSFKIDDVIKFLIDFRPDNYSTRSNDHKIELATALRYTFGNNNVKTEKHVHSGNIDIEIFGLGIEVKSSNMNRGELDRMLSQIDRYQEQYGEKLILIIFFNKSNNSDIEEYLFKIRKKGVKIITK